MENERIIMGTEKTIREVLQDIQSRLVAPKDQKNEYGGYKYRNCEDILEALKPLLKVHGAAVVIDDEIGIVGDRFYVKAIVSLLYKGETISTKAFAREPVARKGMDESQITGATSSYARKYALNGLFAIDDSKDPDATNKHQDEAQETISGIQIHKIRNMLELVGDKDKEAAFCTYLKVNELKDLPVSGFKTAIAALEAKMAKQSTKDKTKKEDPIEYNNVPTEE
jgi:hypothetical protein